MLELIKKEFHKSKQQIDLDLVTVDQIVVSDKFKHSDDGFKYFIGYHKDKLCIILHQMNGFIKYFKKGGKNMSFMVKDDSVLNKYNDIWDKIKEKLNIKFHRILVYDETYIKAKVREFYGKIKTNFLGDEIPKENMHYTCIACLTIDFVMKIEKKKKNQPQLYLEEYKYKVKKIQMRRFINAKLELDSESESKSDTQLDSE